MFKDECFLLSFCMTFVKHQYICKFYFLQSTKETHCFESLMIFVLYMKVKI